MNNRQSIFEKYLIWNTRLLKVNKLCCQDFELKKLNRLQNIQWELMCIVNKIENYQKLALKTIAKKRVEILLEKENGQYLNAPAKVVNDKLMAYINELPDLDINSDWKEFIMYAYELNKLPV